MEKSVRVVGKWGIFSAPKMITKSSLASSIWGRGLIKPSGPDSVLMLLDILLILHDY